MDYFNPIMVNQVYMTYLQMSKPTSVVLLLRLSMSPWLASLLGGVSPVVCRGAPYKMRPGGSHSR